MKEEKVTAVFFDGKVDLRTLKELAMVMETSIKNVFETDNLSITCDWANAADGETFKFDIKRET